MKILKSKLLFSSYGPSLHEKPKKKNCGRYGLVGKRELFLHLLWAGKSCKCVKSVCIPTGLCQCISIQFLQIISFYYFKSYFIYYTILFYNTLNIPNFIFLAILINYLSILFKYQFFSLQQPIIHFFFFYSTQRHFFAPPLHFTASPSQKEDPQHSHQIKTEHTLQTMEIIKNAEKSQLKIKQIE